MASYELKRILGLRSAVIIKLGAIIGAGIFVIIGIAAGNKCALWANLLFLCKNAQVIRNRC